MDRFAEQRQQQAQQVLQQAALDRVKILEEIRHAIKSILILSQEYATILRLDIMLTVVAL